MTARNQEIIDLTAGDSVASQSAGDISSNEAEEEVEQVEEPPRVPSIANLPAMNVQVANLENNQDSLASLAGDREEVDPHQAPPHHGIHPATGVRDAGLGDDNAGFSSSAGNQEVQPQQATSNLQRISDQSSITQMATKGFRRDKLAFANELFRQYDALCFGSRLSTRVVIVISNLKTKKPVELKVLSQGIQRLTLSGNDNVIKSAHDQRRSLMRAMCYAAINVIDGATKYKGSTSKQLVRRWALQIAEVAPLVSWQGREGMWRLSPVKKAEFLDRFP